jgi:hypothetical protein
MAAAAGSKTGAISLPEAETKISPKSTSGPRRMSIQPTSLPSISETRNFSSGSPSMSSTAESLKADSSRPKLEFALRVRVAPRQEIVKSDVLVVNFDLIADNGPARPVESPGLSGRRLVRLGFSRTRTPGKTKNSVHDARSVLPGNSANR